jgi:hypothetical protein
MYNILIVHCYHGEYPIRKTSEDYLFSFRRYSGHRCFYLNLAFSGTPWYLNKIKWDLIIFSHLFTSERWDPTNFPKIVKKAQPLKKINAIKILFNQDEFLYTDVLCDFINEFDIGFVFSNAKESEWRKIYPTVDFKKVRFLTVLTGYLDDHTIEKIKKLSKIVPERNIDIGYRASHAPASWGRHGALKVLVADVFQNAVKEETLKTNISLRREDTFLGDEWYKFLLQCKYTLGVEGGSSILDADGTIRQKTEEFSRKHPHASFIELESACFPGADGSIELFAISPRHLEACATKTCQILVEGQYNEILIPGIHFIELKKDFSNLDIVIERIKEDKDRQEIIDRAYRDIVESGKYNYRNFVKFVIESAIGKAKCPGTSDDDDVKIKIMYQYGTFIESITWTILPFESCIFNKIIPRFPRSFVKVLKRTKEYFDYITQT